MCTPEKKRNIPKMYTINVVQSNQFDNFMHLVCHECGYTCQCVCVSYKWRHNTRFINCMRIGEDDIHVYMYVC